jgi:cytochrome c peroxidase
VQGGTFDAALANEFKGRCRGQLNTDGANGGLGINIPSLLSVLASAPFFHSGAASTLDDAGNVTHRSLGTFGVDTAGQSSRPRKSREVRRQHRRERGDLPGKGR